MRIFLFFSLLIFTTYTHATSTSTTKPSLADTCASKLTSQHAFRDLIDWVSSFPLFETSGIDIRTGEDGDRGFFASREIAADELLIRLPDSLYIHPPSMFNTPYWSERWDLYQSAQFDNYTSMALRLWHEAYDYHHNTTLPVGPHPLGECSPWLPWLRILPQSYSTPPYMTDADFDFMEELTPGSGHSDTLRELKQEIYTAYEQVVALYQAHPTIFTKIPTWEEFLRFHQSIQTRCWTNTTSVPFLEMFNHDGHANVPYFGENDVNIHSHRLYKTGEQLYISYGHQTDWFTLLYYGFIADHNPYNTRKFDINHQHAMYPHLFTAHELSLDLHFGDEDDYLPNNTMAYMRLYVLKPEDFTYHTRIHDYGGILTIQNEIDTLRELMKICNEHLAQHSTSIADDEKKLSHPDTSWGSRLILRYVIKQKKILERVKREIQKRWLEILEFQI